MNQIAAKELYVNILNHWFWGLDNWDFNEKFWKQFYDIYMSISGELKKYWKIWVTFVQAKLSF